MMIRFLIACFLMVSSLGFAGYDENPKPDFGEPDPNAPIGHGAALAHYKEELAKFNAVMAEAWVNPELAGYQTDFIFRGKLYSVDRKGETKRNPRRPPASSYQLSGLLGDLAAKSSGRVYIRVTLETYQDGKLTDRSIWEMDMAGTFSTSTTPGFDEAFQKNHK